MARSYISPYYNDRFKNVLISRVGMMRVRDALVVGRGKERKSPYRPHSSPFLTRRVACLHSGLDLLPEYINDLKLLEGGRAVTISSCLDEERRFSKIAFVR